MDSWPGTNYPSPKQGKGSWGLGWQGRLQKPPEAAPGTQNPSVVLFSSLFPNQKDHISHFTTVYSSGVLFKGRVGCVLISRDFSQPTTDCGAGQRQGGTAAGMCSPGAAPSHELIPKF